MCEVLGTLCGAWRALVGDYWLSTPHCAFHALPPTKLQMGRRGKGVAWRLVLLSVCEGVESVGNPA